MDINSSLDKQYQLTCYKDRWPLLMDNNAIILSGAYKESQESLKIFPKLSQGDDLQAAAKHLKHLIRISVFSSVSGLHLRLEAWLGKGFQKCTAPQI